GELFERRKDGRIPDIVLLLEHSPTVTSGRGAHTDHLLSSTEHLSALGVDVVQTDRGGEVTLHAPGQLVAYPILRLTGKHRDVRKYVNGLTRVMQRQVEQYGIKAGTLPGLVGLWSDKRAPSCWSATEAREPVKLGAIGVRISRWVTMHGFALNFTTNLDLFRHIVPYGIRQHGVASVQSLTGESPIVAEAAKRVLPLLAEELDLEMGNFHVWDGPLEGAVLEQMLTS